jgi:outer membrane immunogenic protein
MAGVAGTMMAGSAAIAADMAVKAPAPVYAPAPADWSGFYLGVHGGGGWGTDPFTFTQTNVGGGFGGNPPGFNLTVHDISSSGFVVGGHFGYNWQYYRSVVVGIELDADAADISGTSSASGSAVIGGGVGPVSATFSLQDKVTTLGTARARLGWLATEWLLLYGTGGLAWERFEQTSTLSQTVGGVTNVLTTVTPDTRFGFVVGAGGEAKLFGSNNWLVRAEYLHYDFGDLGSRTGTLTSGNQTVDVVRGGITFKFGP